MAIGTVTKVGMSGVDEIAREHILRTLKRSVLVLVLLIAVVVLINEKHRIVAAIDHPIQKISVLGEFQFLQAFELEKSLVSLKGTGFLSADLLEVKGLIQSLPWVDEAQVSRVWPGEITVLIKEQVPVAYWNQAGFLNPRGELFVPEVLDKSLGLPELVYANNLDARERLEMFNLFQYVQDELGAANLSVRRLTQSNRGTWDLLLGNDIGVALGRIDTSVENRKFLDDRLERVAKLFIANSGIDFNNVKKLDARYPNGIAVQWKEPVKKETKQKVK